MTGLFFYQNFLQGFGALEFHRYDVMVYSVVCEILFFFFFKLKPHQLRMFLMTFESHGSPIYLSSVRISRTPNDVEFRLKILNLSKECPEN